MALVIPDGTTANVDSVREAILKNIAETMEQILIANNFEFNVIEVSRIRKTPGSYNELPAIAVYDDNEVKSTKNINRYNSELNVILEGWIENMDDDGEAKAINISALLKAMEIAILADRCRDGNAADTQLVGNETVIEDPDQAMAGVIMGVQVIYRYNINDVSVPV